MIQQLWAIGRNTFTESIRQPIYVVMILVGTLALILNPMLSANSLDDDNVMMVDMGCSTLFIAGLLLAAFTATGVLSQEVENKTVLTVVSKPVSRPPLFVTGKYLGVAGALVTAYWILSIVFVLSVRHQVMQRAGDDLDGPVLVFGFGALFVALLLGTVGNYLYQWVFASTFVGSLLALGTGALLLVLMIDKGWHFQPIYAEFYKTSYEPIVPMGQVMLGLILIFEAVMVLTAVAIAASTRLGQVMNLVVCFGVFALGLVSDYLSHLTEKPFEFTGPASTAITLKDTLAASQPAQAIEPSLAHKFMLVVMADKGVGAKIGFLLGKIVYYLTPNLQFFWPTYALIEHNNFSLAYMFWTAGYCVLFSAAVLFLAIASFQTREVG